MDIGDIFPAYQAAARRILFLDYDGTLARFRVDPYKATPSAALLKVLEKLTQQPATTTVIATGRDHAYLTSASWFNDLPVSFVAEHGYFYKDPHAPWQAAGTIDETWKPAVRKLMSQHAMRYKGATYAEKASGIFWHARGMSSHRLAEKALVELAGELATMAEQLGLRVIPGKLVVEVQPRGFNKGTTAQRWLKTGDYDFMLAAGDDVTDEDLFQAMPTGSFTVKVGAGKTRAAYRLPSPKAMLELLKLLAKTS